MKTTIDFMQAGKEPIWANCRLCRYYMNASLLIYTIIKVFIDVFKRNWYEKFVRTYGAIAAG